MNTSFTIAKCIFRSASRTQQHVAGLAPPLAVARVGQHHAAGNHRTGGVDRSPSAFTPFTVSNGRIVLKSQMILPSVVE